MLLESSTENEIQTKVDTQHQLHILSTRRNEHLESLGSMVCKQYPVPLSHIPHPLCNWKIQRVHQITEEIRNLSENILHSDMVTDVLPN